MRIDRLHLLKYRALEDVALDFAAGSKVHVVYGPQEAGKTTALAAIADALFGFPHAVLPNAVRFPPGDLRVEMHLRASDGARLAFRRRKARGHTLLKADESGHLPDHALAPFTGALDRGGFERMFGLTSQRLRAAGAGVEASGGDTGSALFAASSGLADLGRLTARLDDDADALFGPRRKAARRFTQDEDRHAAARKAEAEALLTGARWSELRRALAELEEREGALTEKRADGLRAVRRLELLIRLAPIHGRIRAIAKRLEAFEDLTGVASDEVVRLERLSREDYDAVVALGQAGEALEREQSRLAGVAVDELCLDHAEAVDALVRRSGAVEKALIDLPRVGRQRDEHERDLRTLASRLGVAVEALDGGAPSEPALARLAEAVSEGRRLESERRAVAEARADEAPDETIETPPPDPAPLRKRMDALGPDLARLDTLAERRRKLAAVEATVRDEAARLTPAVGDMDATARWNLPDEASLSARMAAIATTDAVVATVRREIDALDARRGALAAEVAGGVSRSLATREVIAAARAERDAALADGAPVATLRLLVSRADELADRAFADAGAVARHEQHVNELGGLEERRDDLLAARERTERDAAVARGAFDDLFAFTTVTEPERMVRWVDRVSDLRERWGEVGELRRGVAELEALDDAARPALASLGKELDCAVDLPTVALGRLISDALRDAEAAWQDHRRRHALAQERVRRIEALARKADGLQAREAAWRETLAAANAGCGLPSTFGLAEAETAGALWRRVPDLLDMRANAVTRIAGMERDRDLFERDVAATVATLDPALAELSAAAAVERLSVRCREAALSATRRREIERAVADAQGAVERAEAIAEAAQARLANAAAALAGGDAELGAVIERLHERQALREDMERQRMAFAETAAGAEMDEDALDGFDAVAAELELETLRAEADALEAEARDVHAALVAQRGEAAALERAGGAEEHAFARLGAAADMAVTGREWLVLRAARHLLECAVARQRERESGPLMERAGALFARLTGGSFERLEQDYGTGDAPRIVGVRPGGEGGGERVGTDGMSEGTHDQLFLALRLAHLEARAQTNEPVPFIADDIFMTFDRDRTRHGLLALGEVATSFQPILFTHHDFVVDEAETVLGDRLDLIDLSKARMPELA